MGAALQKCFLPVADKMDCAMSYRMLPLNDRLKQKIAAYKLPDPLGFGQNLAPAMVSSQFCDGQWEPAVISELQEFSFPLNSKVFHYGQQIFEGMKAYRGPHGEPRLFRPEENFKRFNLSAGRMAMPRIDAETFLGSLSSLVYHLRDKIPAGEGESLYLRPVMIAYDTGLSLAPASSYLFYILASPSGSYFSSSRVAALIEREDCRAAPGGTGAAKTGGNYGASIKSAMLAKQLGYQQTLWLDAVNHKYIEEFSGMNFFAVVDGELLTPRLTDSILPGVTRNSLIKLATLEGMTVREVALDIDELITQIESGRCSEVFACGTAAVITPLAELGEKDGRRYQVKHEFGPVARLLRKHLLGIQSGQAPDPLQWSVPVPVAAVSQDSESDGGSETDNPLAQTVADA